MEKQKKNKSALLIMFSMGCAFASYNIGSGFASGQVPLQYFCSGGGVWAIISSWILVIMLGLFTYWALHTGSVEKFDDPNKAFIFYTENRFAARVVDIWTLCVLGIMACMMTSGAGATIAQYTGIPSYVGSIILGVLACIVVCLGLEGVKKVMSTLGAFLSLFMVVLAIVSFSNPDNSLWEGAQKIPELVSAGKVAEPTLFGFKSKLLTPLYYIGCCIIISVPFLVALGKNNVRSKKEAMGGGAFAALLFGGATVIISYTLLLNIDYIVEKGMQIPVLTAIQKNLPLLSLPFTIVILAAIFSTVTGFLWLIGRRFAEDKTWKQRIIVICACIFCTVSGSFIPFSKFVSFVYPISGIGGLLIFVYMAIHRIRYRKVLNNYIPTDDTGMIKKDELKAAEN